MVFRNVFLALFFLLIPSVAFAVPQFMNYQGKLTDSAGTPITGSANITFSLYDSPTGGTQLWTEAQSVNLANGIFSVTLGSVVTLPADICSGDSLYLGITVEGDSEMTPRQRITTNGYTFKAGTADTVSAGAVSTQGIADGAVTDAKISSMDASKLTGTISDASLSANVARLDASQTFSGVQTGTFAGDGSGLTGITTSYADSAGNADMVDGMHASDFAPSSGSAAYVAKSGDTMSGPLTINTSTSGLTVNTTNSSAGYYTCVLGTGVYGQGGNVGLSGSGSTGVHGTGSQYGVQGNVTGSAKAVYGVTTGMAEAGYFQINNPSSSASALYAATNGTGYALKADSTNGTPKAAKFTGAVDVTGAVTATSFSGDGSGLTGVAKQHTGAVYRWAEFDTYDNSGNWMYNNDASMFGGVTPQNWTDNNGLASQMSADKEVLRMLFTRKGYGSRNAIVNSVMHSQYSSTTGHVTLALFRIKNTTGSDIIWTPFFYYTAYNGWGETASVALNGASAWTSGTSAPGGSSTSINLTIPASRTSTVIFVSPSGNVTSTGAGVYVRPDILAFYNNSLLLPAGLEYLDDLDTATGGWEQ